MWNEVRAELFGSIIVKTVLAFLLGLCVNWLFVRWRYYKDGRKVWRGDARESLSMEYVHVVYSAVDERNALAIRSCGTASMEAAIHNPSARAEFLARVDRTTAAASLVPMHGQDGSYILAELQKFTCDKLGLATGRRQKWVMAPISEPRVLNSGHQSTTILLVREEDLEGCFSDWASVKDMLVEHRGDGGARLLTLYQMAQEYRRQKEAVRSKDMTHNRSTFEETMYHLDLGIPEEVISMHPLKEVPWSERFGTVLTALKLAA